MSHAREDVEKGAGHGSPPRGAPKSSLASPVIASALAARSRTAPVAVAAGPPLPEPPLRRRFDGGVRGRGRDFRVHRVNVSVMRPDARSVFAEALRLPLAERATLAAELLASMDDEADPDAEQAWAAELEARAARALRGESDARDFDGALGELRARLARR